MKHEAVLQEYLPVNPHLPHYPICKEIQIQKYLLEVIDEF